MADLRIAVSATRVSPVRIDSGLLDWLADYCALTYKVIARPDGMATALVPLPGTLRTRFGQLRPRAGL